MQQFTFQTSFADCLDSCSQNTADWAKIADASSSLVVVAAVVAVVVVVVEHGQNDRHPE